MAFENGYLNACLASYIILMDQNDRVFMLRRQNTDWYNGAYCVPAGRVERYETVQTAAIRELKEEAGIDVSPQDIQLFHISNRCNSDVNDTHADWVDFFFLVRTWRGTPHAAEAEKCDHADWFALDALPDLVIPNVLDALEYLKKGTDLSYGLSTVPHLNLMQRAVANGR